MKLRPIIVIAGPTATGKSNIAIKLAKEINGVILNADSRQIYKEMMIGTARPSVKQLLQAPHQLYGTVSVKDDYNIYEYQKAVFAILKKIPKNQVPILVGGTGLYIDSVIYNYNLKSQEDIDTEKEKVYFSKTSVEKLQKKIPKEILEKLNNSDKNNPRRLQRIIERGNKLNNGKGPKPFPHAYFVLDVSQDILKTRIEKRVNEMIENGLIEENRQLREEGLNKYFALNSIGYSEFNDYFENEKTIEEVKSEMITNTLQYAKRQRTWFKRNPEAIWTTSFDLILKESKNLLKCA